MFELHFMGLLCYDKALDQSSVHVGRTVVSVTSMSISSVDF